MKHVFSPFRDNSIYISCIISYLCNIYYIHIPYKIFLVLSWAKNISEDPDTICDLISFIFHL